MRNISMDILKSHERQENKRQQSGFLSQLFFWYLNNTFKEGYKRPLSNEDIYKINNEYTAPKLSEKLERMWKQELLQERKEPSLSMCIAKFGLSLFGWTVIILLVCVPVKFSQTFFLRYLIASLSEKDAKMGYCWAGLLTLSMILVWLLHHQYFYLSDSSGSLLKSGVTSLIFKKILRLSNGSLSNISTGHVVTLVSSDAHKFQELCKFIFFIFIAPLMLITVIVILWLDFGVSTLPGVAVFGVSLTAQSLLGKYFAYMRLKTVRNTDKRVSIMNEVISSMQVTKMYSWEKSFAEKIHDIRKIESRCIMKSSLIRSLNCAMFGATPYLVSLAIFGTFYARGGELSLPMVFQTLALLFAVRFEVIQIFPLTIQLVMEARVGCKRIQKFLLHKEMEPHQPLQADTSNSPDSPAPSSSSECEVVFENVSATWDDTSDKPVFHDISFTCNSKNNLVMIVGPVGSGKSSILMAALREMRKINGNINVNGSIAYAAQQPWIFSGTVRQNILFGKEYNKEKYMEVIKACSMIPDIKSFDQGDMTLVGEKGVSLSGGQKARICLARAVYHDADIYLLDDPLSAVDAKVGKQIFERCIQGVLKDKIVLLVTHQVQYLKFATDIVCLENGTACEGTLKDFLRRGVDLESFLSVDEDEDEHDEYDHHEDDKRLSVAPSGGLLLEGNLSTSILSLHSLSSLHHMSPEYEAVEENKATGQIGLKLYYEYIIKGLGWFPTLVAILSILGGQAAFTFADIYIAEWINRKNSATIVDVNATSTIFYFKENPSWNLYIFSGIVILNALIAIFRAMYFFACLIKCSRNLHNQMFEAVVKAPLYFFDTNPIGQILNRFSRDIFLMDEELPWIFFDFVNLTCLTLSIIILNCISIPYLLILFLPLFGAFLYFRNYYLSTAREIKRLEAIARSPLYTHISATLAGLSSIRSFNLAEKILGEFYHCLDHQIEAWIFFLETCRWFGQRIDFLGLVFNTFAIFSPVVAVQYTDVDAGIAGVGLTYTLVLCGMFQFCVRQSAEVENLMVSTERVYEYSRLDSEPDHGSSKDLSKQWPQQGSIVARNASYSYHSTLPNVLNRLNFKIKPQEKIGIVGRTGAGKSSLLNMLFRLGVNTGEIKIDDRDISELKLEDLRSSLSVIPQDPVLFGGTLRKNLDPFSDFHDEDIWEALEKVQMKKLAAEFSNKLETEITESGSNLSVGERQLLCLARALLKKNKILVIDEATANVDYETDSLIQSTIREKFQECTVLTIAHRLNTIMDSDRIMVLDAGDIVEFDAPYKLLQIKSGILRKLVDQTGEDEAGRLELQAKNAMKNVDTTETKENDDIDNGDDDGLNSEEAADGAISSNGACNMVVTFDDIDDPQYETERLLKVTT